MDLAAEDEEKQDTFWEHFENFQMSSSKFIKTQNINKQGKEQGEDHKKEAFYDHHNHTNNGIERQEHQHK